MRYFIITITLTISFLLNSCGIYNFTGAKPVDAKTFQVNYFQNNAPLIEPGIERTFTLELQEIIQNQTNLNLVSQGGDLLYEGEIVDLHQNHQNVKNVFQNYHLLYFYL